jgi:DNA-binding winged helix-turn-helix (wHTH) protein/tetratricopeptide (TPR) repeat protein
MFPTPKGSYQFGEFQLNADLRVLTRGGQRVALGSKAYDVLTCLVLHAGQAVRKSDLLKEVWAGSFVEEGTLTQHIFSLRKALGDKADCIVTVPGYGYRLEGTVRHLTPDAGVDFRAGVVQEMRERMHVVIEQPIVMPQQAAARPVARRAPVYMACAAGVLLAPAVAGWMWIRRPAPPDHLSVVLSDFTNNTGDATFDRTLKRALEIDLEQSPYMDVLSETGSAETLQRMGQKTDVALTPEVAREICERNNRQALLSGSISSVGDEYFLTVEATECSTGKRLASAKAETASKTQVLASLDALAERVRSKLGESAKSVKGYDVPIEEATTSSLDALKAYSTGMYLQAQGRPFSESVPLFQRAVEIDPNFASAYGQLAFMYGNMGENRKEDEYLLKCYDLRDRMGVKDKLIIQAHYYDEVQKDWTAAIKAYEAWAASYPGDWVPWVDAANLYTQLGEFAPSIADAQRALELKRNVITYDVLGRAYKYTGRFAEAKALVQQAALEGKDSSTLHTFLYEIAFDEGDAAALSHEESWLAAHKGSEHDYFAGEAAAMQGRYRQAEEMFSREVAVDRQEGLTELADSVAIEQAEMEREVGKTAQARVTLDQLGKEAQDDPDYVLQRAMLGEMAAPEHFLAAHGGDAHPDTGVVHREIPEMRAAIALRRQAPLEAVADLQPAKTQEWPHVSVLSERGQAYLQAGQAEMAARDFHAILDHPGASFAVDRPLAHLGLARAYAAGMKAAEARAEYQAFLGAWKDGDEDLPVVMQAKAELARLR